MLVLSGSQQDRATYQQRVENYLSGYFDAIDDFANLDHAWSLFDSEGDETNEEELFMLNLENEVDDLAEAEALFIEVYDRLEKSLPYIYQCTATPSPNDV